MCYNYNIMTNVEIIKKLSNSNSVCIIGHIDPDADALASMSILKDFLKNYFNISRVDMFADTDEIQENCKLILNQHDINPTPTIYDTAIAVDSPNIFRLGKFAKLFENSKQTILIDHHDTSTKYAQYNIVASASSTVEIIFQLLEQFNYNFTLKNYEDTYSGIITDTNNFTTPNINSNTFKTVSKIIEKIDHIKLYNNFFSNFSINSMKLLSFAIKNIISMENNKILITFLTDDDFKNANADINNIPGIINKLSATSNNVLACLIYKKDNDYYVSMRSKYGYNVANIAKKFNGGGHQGASGFLSKLPLNELINLIKQEFLNELLNN